MKVRKNGESEMPAVKAYKGMGMEGSVARWYERTARKDMPEIKALAQRIAVLVPKAGSILEVASGPGFLSIELAKRGFEVRAVDISETFVAIARRNAVAEGVRARFDRANAAALPVEDASTDFVVCRAAFKNFADPVKALSEMRRVLKDKGAALLIDMRRDVLLADLQRYTDGLRVGWFSRQLMMFIFRHMLIKRAHSLGDVRRMVAQTGWTETKIETTPLGFEALLSK
jgi:ubiquinone/menaquinone biosynthesis C-methylase UbiE